MPTLKDWVVQLQFDDSKVTKGIKDLDNKFAKLGGAEAKRMKNKFSAETAHLQSTTKFKNQANKTLFADMLKQKEIVAKAERNAYKEKEVRESRLSKQKEREIRQEKRKRLAIYKAESAAYAENARRKIKADKEAFRNQTKLTPLSFRGRLSEEQRIGRSQVQARGALSSLSGRTDKKSVRLASSLQREIQRLEAAQKRLSKTTYTNTDSYQRLSRSIQVSRNNVSSFSMEAKKLNREMNAGKFAVNGFNNSLKNMARSYISVFAAIGAATSGLRIAKDFERIRAVMLLSSSSAAEAGQNFEFVSQLADRLGADISATADAFAGFNVSAVSAGISAEESKNIFTELATSVQATGLDAHRSGLAFLAFKQMLAGPVIQAQEMNQVVEQMPQFTGLAIRALKELGYQGENFRKIIATGTVDSGKFVRVVARLANEQAVSTGAAEASQNNIIAAQNRLSNSYKAMVRTIFESGLSESLVEIFKSLSGIATSLGPVVSVIAKSIGAIVGVTVDAIMWIDKLSQSLGFENGLASILTGIAAVLVGGKLIAGIIGMAKALKQLAVASALVQAIVGGPAGIAKVVAGVGAAAGVAYTADAIFSRSAGSSSSSNMTNNTNINQNININSTSDPQEIRRTIQNAWEV